MSLHAVTTLAILGWLLVVVLSIWGLVVSHLYRYALSEWGRHLKESKEDFAEMERLHRESLQVRDRAFKELLDKYNAEMSEQYPRNPFRGSWAAKGKL